MARSRRCRWLEAVAALCLLATLGGCAAELRGAIQRRAAADFGWPREDIRVGLGRYEGHDEQRLVRWGSHTAIYECPGGAPGRCFCVSYTDTEECPAHRRRREQEEAGDARREEEAAEFRAVLEGINAVERERLDAPRGWRSFPSPPQGGTALRAIWGTSERDLWVAGEGGRVLHYDGSVWTAQPTPADEAVNALWGSSGSDIWAVGEGGLVLHFDGTEWGGTAAVTRADLQALWGRGPDDVWAVGRHATVLHFDGQAWSRVAVDLDPSTNHLYGITGSSRDGPWIVGGALRPPDDIYGGSHGVALRYDGSAFVVATIPGTVLRAAAMDGDLVRAVGWSRMVPHGQPSVLTTVLLEGGRDGWSMLIRRADAVHPTFLVRAPEGWLVGPGLLWSDGALRLVRTPRHPASALQPLPPYDPSPPQQRLRRLRRRELTVVRDGSSGTQAFGRDSLVSAWQAPSGAILGLVGGEVVRYVPTTDPTEPLGDEVTPRGRAGRARRSAR